MPLSLPDTIALLSRTPAALNALLRGLPETWTLRNEGENTWTPFAIVAHLIYADRTDWVPRAKLILQFGEARAFDPFDRSGHLREMESKSFDQLLDEFPRVRSKSLEQLRSMNLQPADLDRQGRHPAFGPVTLSQLLATWAAHDLTHLHQLSRVMAHQYCQAVGPFAAFLGVLQCAGHSASA
ncbi:MAG TPA: DinB family protein [Candidatus Acidoferrum sp.]|nr:DinB family protein [Candidatus Acidoferrum sp.]